jgi:hypothetical protein
MEALQKLIRSGNFERAFRECSIGGSLKFNGVSYAFFTKLFFFLGQVGPALRPAPLILDSWTSNAFLILGYQACKSPKWRDMFDTEPLCDDAPASWTPSAESYRLYVAWFNHWADQLRTTPAQLEQFVFGQSRKTRAGKAESNPRNELIALGKTLFCTPSAP